MTEGELRVGVIGLAGGWSSNALADAVAERTGTRLLLDMEHAWLDSEAGTVRCGDVDLCGLDGLLVKKVGDLYGPDHLDRLELLRLVAAKGVPVLSDPEGMLRLLNRLSCTAALVAAGIPMPRTVVTPDPERAAAAVRHFGTAILKPLYSTKARGMVVVEADAPDLESRVRAFRDTDNPVLYVQQKVAVPDRDLGVAFLGGDYLGTYARVRAAGAWTTSTAAGGRYEAHEPSPGAIDTAQKAQAVFGLSFTTVDVVETGDGPLVFEVSAFGGFRGLREGLGLDAAALYADWALRRIRGG